MKHIAILTLFLSLLLTPCFAAEDVVLLDVSKSGTKGLYEQWSKMEVQNGRLHLTTEPNSTAWPGFNTGKTYRWNLSHCDRVVIDVTNHGTEAITLQCRLDSPERDMNTMRGTYTQSTTIAAGETTQWSVPLRPVVPQQLALKFFGMRGAPGGGDITGFDPEKTENAKPAFHKDAVSHLIIFLNQPTVKNHWSIGKIVAKAEKLGSAGFQPAPGSAGVSPAHDWTRMTPDEFFPFIDVFGQFKYADWPGKVHSLEELKAGSEKEKKEMAAFPGPKDRSQYGGSTKRPKRNATGHFRVEKIDGKWWFVDPDGHLFWSHGTDCVLFGHGDTPISGREFYFDELPKEDDPMFRVCFRKSTWATNNPYYQKHNPFTTFNIAKANLIRKYGPTWKADHTESTHQRLKSWGLNTIANWSDREIYGKRRIPYTATFNTEGPRIEGSSGYWGKFPDPFSREFEGHVNWRAEDEAKRSGDDPWCLGYFVDNELSWGGDRSLSLGAITSPASQAAKIVFVDDLKAKYGEIGKLNDVWGTNHASWNVLLESKTAPDETKAKRDLDDFHKKVCEKYFKTIHDAIEKYAPKKMYFGCRFAWANEPAIRASAEYCDVIGFNQYTRTLDAFKLPEGIDKPVIIGEFHFGALDRGMFHTGLVPTDSQQDRADSYEKYVRSGLNHPLIVGTHWFQYSDQATTGREDGENYQIGLVNIVDVPYPETIKAVRKVGYDLYEIRK